jgi:hypothetical protein
MTEPDYYCIGTGCMRYCNDCKWRARWDEVGEFPRDDREVRWPNLVRLSNDACQITSGKLFVAKESAQ